MARIRTQDERSTKVGKIFKVTTGEVRLTNSVSVGEVRTCIDTFPTDFKKAKAEGRLCLNGVTLSKSGHRDTSSEVTIGPVPQNGGGQWDAHTYTGPYYTNAMLGISPPAWVESDLGSARSNCIAEAYAEASASTSQLGVTMAEFEKTKSMLASPLSRARFYAGKMNSQLKSRVQKGQNASLAASSVWLEYRMGWKPLIYDIEQQMKALEKTMLERSPIQSAKKTFSRNWEQFFDASRKDIPWFNNIYAMGTYRLKCVVGAKVFYRHRLSHANPYQALHNFGLGVEDIPSMAWELTRFSFVVDRFINIQAWLQNLLPSWTIEHLGAYSFEKKDRSQLWNIGGGKVRVGTGFPAPGDFVWFDLPGAEVEDYSVVYQRFVPAFPPSLPTEVPREITFAQHLDHVALTLGLLNQFLNTAGSAWRNRHVYTD